MTELERKIVESSQAYYTDGSSKYTDSEFDAMIADLRSTNPDSPILNAVGHGYQLELDTTAGIKVAHKYGCAGSLTKAYSYEELMPTLKTIAVDLSSKMDGLSVVLYYRNGVLVQALTRGNGTIGIDITTKIKTVIGLNILDKTFTGAVRGEIIMSFDNFQNFKCAHPDASNIRNSCAGLINGNTITDDYKYLDIVVYSVVGLEHSDMLHATNVLPVCDMRAWLSINFTHCAPSDISYGNDKEILINNICTHRLICKEYPTDGVVLTTCDADVTPTGQVILNAQAFKFQSETADVTVLAVIWNMSKTGYCVPKVQYTPVQLAGTTVQLATGYNAKYIVDNKIGAGALVEVEKRGEIIPNINRVIEPATSSSTPTHCPDCGEELVWDSVHLKCKNELCGNAIAQDTMIWTSTLAPVDSLGTKLKATFLNQVYSTIPDIESLMSEKPTAFQTAPEGTQAYRMKQMFDSLFGNSVIPLEVAIKALNIPRFGDKNAAALASCSTYIQTLIHATTAEVQSSCIYALRHLIGNANSQTLQDNLTKLSRLLLIENRIDWSVSWLKPATEQKGKVAITGKLSVKRSQFEAELKSAGYTPADICKETQFLITDDPTSSSSKNKKADSWGITKITEQEFRSLYMK